MEGIHGAHSRASGFIGGKRKQCLQTPRHDGPFEVPLVEGVLSPLLSSTRPGTGPGWGDLFMSLIHTCELNGVNAFDYLTELQRHAGEVKQNPAEWMPWNYRQALARIDSG